MNHIIPLAAGGAVTGELLRTGQLNWPIPVLVCAGLFFLGLGLILLRRKDDSDET